MSNKEFPDVIARIDMGEPLAWAVSRWEAEVKNRPVQNVHRRSLDDTWRQVIRHFGGDPVALCGPDHDDLLAPVIPASADGDDDLIERLRHKRERLRHKRKLMRDALTAAPRPSGDGASVDPVEYMDWFFKVRLAALQAGDLDDATD
jgi:hypothetical protein